MNVDRLDQKARDAEKTLGVAHAALATAAASETVVRLRRARELEAHFPRACRQNSLVHNTRARIWQIARKEAYFFA